MGCLNAVAMPAEFALLPLVAGERGMARANGRVEFARYAGFILGPALGGLLAAAGGTTGALLANAGDVPGARGGRRRRSASSGARTRMRRASACATGSTSSPATRECAPVTGDRVRLAAADDGDARGRAVLRRRRPAHGRRGLRDPDGGVGRRDGDRRVRGRPAVHGAARWRAARWRRSPRRGSGSRCRRCGRWCGSRWPATCSAAIAHGTKNVLARTLIHERAPERLHGRAFAAFNGLRNGAELVALTLGGVAISELGARWTPTPRALRRAGDRGVCRAGAGCGVRLVRAALAQEALELAREHVARRELARVRRGRPPRRRRARGARRTPARRGRSRRRARPGARSRRRRPRARWRRR